MFNFMHFVFYSKNCTANTKNKPMICQVTTVEYFLHSGKSMYDLL